MPYISSNANRFYCAAESGYGQVSAITAINRFPAVKLTAKQQVETAQRKDKTGSRTFAGLPSGVRRRTTFDLKTYLTSWVDQTKQPSYGPLFQATLGAAPLLSAGGAVGVGSSGAVIIFSSPHGLTSGQAVSYSGEIRFVASITNPLSVQLNAPFSATLASGAVLGRTVTYLPATELPSVTLFDYWTPTSAVHRILCGAAIGKMESRLNGDYHEFDFSGVAQELIDSTSFAGGIGQLTTFPDEPAAGAFDYSVVPGHLGQVWLGNTPDRFYTITDAALVVDNALDLRAKEFGSSLPRAISPGRRSVSAAFTLYEQDDAATKELYQAAKQRSPIPVMFQLGQQSGQLFGAYFKSVIPEVPEYDDADARLQWQFRDSRAQGTVDDEIVVGFA